MTIVMCYMSTHFDLGSNQHWLGLTEDSRTIDFGLDLL